jgi:hypothetical protein
MERKGKFLCRSPVCSLFIGGRGRARRRSSTSSLGCSASTFSTVRWTKRKRRHRPITTPHTTPGRPRACTRTKVLLCRTLEAPLHGRVGRVGQVGIDLHLGQKPKLGARYADGSLIYISYFVGTLYIHVSLSLLFLFLFPLSKTQKDQKYFHCFSSFAFLVSSFGLLCSLFSVWCLKNPKIFCFVCYFLPFLFQKSKTQKYLLFFFGFVKFVVEFSLPWLHWSLVFTSYYSSHTSEKAIMTTYDNLRCGKRLV